MTVGSAHELFALDPQEFVRERDTLAKQLRADGDRDEAARVKALRRPTVAAWALNQVAREHADVVEALLDARTAHASRESVAARREATLRVLRAVRDVVAASGRDRDAHDRDIEELLNAAVTRDSAADVLRRGELTGSEAGAPADEDALLASLAASVPEGAPRRARAPKAKPEPPRPSPALVRARRDVEKAEERLRAAEQHVDEARAALEDARRRVEDLENEEG